MLGFALEAGDARGEEIQVVKSGKYYGKLAAYRAGDHFYLGAKEAARLYGAQLYWYSVRGQVRLSFRGKQVTFRVDSKEASVVGKGVALPRPVIVRASQAFIPVEFFTGREFSRVAGVDSKFNAKTRLLLVNHQSSVGPLRWFTYPDHTRVVLEVAEGLRYQTSKRGRSGFSVAMPNGTIDWSEKIDVSDGVVEYIHLFQEAKQAQLLVSLQAGAGSWRLREFKKPRRLVIDVPRAPGAEARAGRIAMEAPAPPRRGAREKKTAARKGETRARARAIEKDRGRRYRVAIDPGHGGRDGGAVGRRGTLEKNINLAAAKELSRLLEQEGMFEVKLTRTKDAFLRLGVRSKISNEFEADLFISLHCNAHSSRNESGYEIYFLSERASDPDAERLAEFENSVLELEDGEPFEDAAAGVLYALAKTEFINDAAELAGLMAQSLSKRVDMRNRGVKQAAFYVLRGANAPAVLVEMAFLSNGRDEAKLQSSKYRRKIVEGLYAGVLEFAQRKGWRTRRRK